MKIFFLAMLFFFSCAEHVAKTPGPLQVSQPVSGIPECLLYLIQKLKADSTTIPPQSIKQYTFNGQTVFYVTAGCCDKYNIVYNSNCKVLGSPDGGFTGKGDGSLPEFFKEATNEKVVWKNK